MMLCRCLVIYASNVGLLQVFLGFPNMRINACMKKIKSHFNLPQYATDERMSFY
jgi:hypothetical protein